MHEKKKEAKESTLQFQEHNSKKKQHTQTRDEDTQKGGGRKGKAKNLRGPSSLPHNDLLRRMLLLLFWRWAATMKLLLFLLLLPFLLLLLMLLMMMVVMTPHQRRRRTPTGGGRVRVWEQPTIIGGKRRACSRGHGTPQRG